MEDRTEFSIDMESYKLPETKRSKDALPIVYPEIARNKGGVDFDIYDYNMLFNDEGTKKIIREGKTIGCFYIESPGMRSLLKKLDCDNFELLTAASSVIRPGVAESGMMQEFILRHKNPQRRKYLLPQLKEILSETYGVMIYQEDVIKVAHLVVGLTLEEADLLRRAMSGKMRSHNAMQQVEARFFESCREKGYNEYVVKELWRQIESFAGYAFCKAHSASFALLSFQVAYLKVHYPAEFLSSVLSNGGGYYLPAVYIQEAKRLGIEVLLPCVNNSMVEYTGYDKLIRIGFLAIKGLRNKTAEKIVEERTANGEYKSLLDFLLRVKPGYEDTYLLIKIGAMQCFNKTRPALMRLLDIYIKHRRILEADYFNLFEDESIELEKLANTDVEYSIEEICAAEYELFDFMVTKHPLYFFERFTKRPEIIKAADMAKYAGKSVKMIGWYMASKRIKTKSNRIMKFLSLEDLTGTFEAVIFPKEYELYAEMTLSMGPYYIKGTVDAEGGNNIIVEKMAILSVKNVKTVSQKDSAENNYFGDVERVDENEFNMVNVLDQEKLRQAYL
jgi:DNA polymerase III alpha subunit